MMLVGQISNRGINYQSTLNNEHRRGALPLDDETTSVIVHPQTALVNNEVGLTLGITQLQDELSRHHIHDHRQFAHPDREHGGQYPSVASLHANPLIASDLPFRPRPPPAPSLHHQSSPHIHSQVSASFKFPQDNQESATYTTPLHPTEATRWTQPPVSAEEPPSYQLPVPFPQQQPQLSHTEFRLSLDPFIMRYASGDLAILGAESYDVAIKHPSAQRASKRSKKTAAATVTEVSGDDPPRKRNRLSPADGVGDEEEKKRSRGRPRLEPKDETAQDRRRTQIRLAQRAYRNRKENAIQTLERQVQELKDTNAEMNNAFLRLHDFAVSQGVLDHMPDVGRQLRETTQKFLKLARKSTEDGSADGDNDSSPQDLSNSSHERSNSPTELVERPSVHILPPRTQEQLYGGFIVTQESVPATLPSLASPALTSNISGPPVSNPHPDYEVVSYPTLDNASFPFGFDADFSFTAPDLTTSTSTSDFSSLSPSLYPSLPLPNSFAAQEVTFGRRFQRSALERAIVLINTPNPPAQRFSRVFGFCLLFEPLESIRARLQHGIEKTKYESLNNWQYPFHQLGGAGTHFDTSSMSTQHRFGNQGTVDILRPKNGNGYGMGPFNDKVNAARETLDGNYMTVVGPRFGGEFYDSDEIEIYLYERGVSIPAGADYITVEVEDNAFNSEDGKTGSIGASGTGVFGATDTALGTSNSKPGSGSGSSSSSPSTSSKQSSAITAPNTYAQTDLWAPGVYSQDHAGSSSLFDGFTGFPRTTAPGKKRLALDVNRLILELVERSTCLGRTPGLRKEDINAAFWAAAKPTL